MFHSTIVLKYSKVLFVKVITKKQEYNQNIQSKIFFPQIHGGGGILDFSVHLQDMAYHIL